MTSSARLNTIAPDLTDVIQRAESNVLNDIGKAVCDLVLTRVKLASVEVSLAMRLINDRFGDANHSPDLSNRLLELVDSLDEQYFDLQEDYEQASSDSRPYLHKFEQARAANTVLLAMKDPNTENLCDVIYEANAAINDLPALRGIVENIVNIGR